MDLKSRLAEDSKVALKSKDAVALAALRLVLAAIKNEELKDGTQLDDAGVIAVLSTLAKQRRESIEAFEKGGRMELAAKEKAELEILKRYMPAALSEEELGRLIDEAIAESKAASPADMGKVMKLIMPKTKGRADGSMVSDIVRRKLST